jgi:hypothetical protein
MKLAETLTPAEIVLKNYHSQIMRTVAIISGFCLAFFLLCLVKTPYEIFIANYIGLQSEYSLYEQLSSFYLFIIILNSVISYQISNDIINVKLSILFLVLGLAMYMSEHNMIKEITQPIFGLIFGTCLCVLLFRLRSWLCTIFLIVGFMSIAFGALIDFAWGNESAISLLPDFVTPFVHPHLERFLELAGIAFLCLCSIIQFHAPLSNFVSKNRKEILMILLSVGMISFGNGFIHYLHRPSSKLFLFGMVLTISGFLGLVFTCQNINKIGAKFMLVSEKFFNLFIFFFFLVLPSIHGRPRLLSSLLLWLPTMLFMAYYLWRCHPVQTQHS